MISIILQSFLAFKFESSFARHAILAIHGILSLSVFHIGRNCDLKGKIGAYIQQERFLQKIHTDVDEIVSIIEATNAINDNPNINLSSKQTSKVYESKGQYDLVVNERMDTHPERLALVFEKLLVEVDLLLFPPGRKQIFAGKNAYKVQDFAVLELSMLMRNQMCWFLIFLPDPDKMVIKTMERVKNRYSEFFTKYSSSSLKAVPFGQISAHGNQTMNDLESGADNCQSSSVAATVENNDSDLDTTKKKLSDDSGGEDVTNIMTTSDHVIARHSTRCKIHS